MASAGSTQHSVDCHLAELNLRVELVLHVINNRFFGRLM